MVRFEIENAAQMKQFQQVTNNSRNITIMNRVAVGSVDVMMSTDASSKFDHIGIKKLIVTKDIQKLIESEDAHSFMNSHQTAGKVASGIAIGEQEMFRDYQDTDSYIAFLAGQPGASQISIGKSFLGADIPGVVFGSGKKLVVVHGAIHAREWIAPATVAYLANELLKDTPRSRQLRGNFTFTFIPVLNVDGYAFTRDKLSGDRFWRKNRQTTKDPRCAGVDLNRNFPGGWSLSGASGDPCEEDYYGEKALSAPETSAIFTYVKGLNNVVAYTDFHAYGQLWLYPYGYDCGLTAKNADQLEKAAEIATDAINDVNGLNFKAGPICQTIYRTSGGSADAMYDIGVDFPNAVELRGLFTDPDGFALPAIQILASGQEITAGMFAYWEYIASVTNRM